MYVAESRMQIDQCRLLVLKATHAIDCKGTKGARKEVRGTHKSSSPCVSHCYFDDPYLIHLCGLVDWLSRLQLLRWHVTC